MSVSLDARTCFRCESCEAVKSFVHCFWKSDVPFVEPSKHRNNLPRWIVGGTIAATLRTDPPVEEALPQGVGSPETLLELGFDECDEADLGSVAQSEEFTNERCAELGARCQELRKSREHDASHIEEVGESLPSEFGIATLSGTSSLRIYFKSAHTCSV